ncbi:MAG: CHC2 zinc finger domain-containing protein [Deltaproteobacteria bacterium]
MTSTASLDFRFLKSRVTIERVLAARGLLAPMRRHGHNLVGPCPIHHGDSTTAFVVSTAKDLWHCFTGCRGGGDVIDLVRRLDSSDYRATALYLASLAGVVREARPDERPFQPFTARLKLDPAVSFLAEKGIRPSTARAFDAGFHRGSGFLHGCIAVRLHDYQGQPVGYAGRVLDPDRARSGKWRLPARLPKRTLLFNVHRVRERLQHGLVLVEDPWSVMRLAQIGVPAVALLGTAISNQQAELLAHAGRILIMLDGDAAGRIASRELRARLASAQIAVAELPADHDPDQLSDHDLRACCYLFLPALAHHAA